MIKEFNINDNVSVKLTDYGRTILEHQHYTLYEKISGDIPKYVPPTEDDDGWSKWQLWSLMSAFGSSIYMGSNLPFETTIKIHHPKLDIKEEILIYDE